MQIEAIVRGALGARSLELDGFGKNIICTRKTAKHTSCNGIKNTQQIALKMLKSKHSPWSLAAELTLKQAPYQKHMVRLYNDQNGRLRAKIDSDTQKQ